MKIYVIVFLLLLNSSFSIRSLEEFKKHFSQFLGAG